MGFYAEHLRYAKPKLSEAIEGVKKAIADLDQNLCQYDCQRENLEELRQALTLMLVAQNKMEDI